MNGETIAVVLGVGVNIITLMGIIFKGGEFIGRVNTLIDGLILEVAELKEELKTVKMR